MSLLNKAWGYLAAIAGAVLAVAGIFFAGRKAGKDSANLKATEKAQQTERKATEALTAGLSNEQQALAAARRRRRARFDRLRDGDKPETPTTPRDS